MAMETVFYDGRPIFEAANSKELAKAVEAFDDDVKPPYVVRIPDGVTEVAGSAFFKASIDVVFLPNSVTKIEYNAFDCCANLSDIVIPDSVEEIGNCAFKGCVNLTKIYIPQSVTLIGQGAFLDCEWLVSIQVSPDNQVYNSHGNCNAIIETESNKLILGCKNTIIPHTVEEIGSGAFRGSVGLKRLTIPSSVTYIGDKAFENCKGLENIDLRHSKITKIVDDTFRNCTSLKRIHIPNTVTKILGDTFSGCTSLTDVYLPNSLTEIASRVFEGCTSLNGIYIPDSVKEIGERAFKDCTSLVEIDIHNSVKVQGYYGGWFQGCKNLERIYTNHPDLRMCRDLNILPPRASFPIKDKWEKETQTKEMLRAVEEECRRI